MTDRPLPQELLTGFGRFRATRWTAEHDRYRRLAEGQRPASVVIACSDSRVAPEILFDAGPGELFVVRNVAGLVPVYAPDARSHAASAALEYAVIALGVRHVVVMGHGRCGGVAAALDVGAPALTATDFIGTWVAPIRDLAAELEPSDWGDPARARRDLEHRSVEQSLANLRTFPWIRTRERAGTLELHGCWYDIALGELHTLADDRWIQVQDR